MENQDVGRCPSGRSAGPSDPSQSSLSRPSAAAANAFSVPDGLRFEYRFSVREGRERHDWSIAGKTGGVNVWAEPSSGSFGDRWYGGVEVHAASAPDYMDAAKPSQELCWLILKPCWHDGSSLFFSERIEPMLPPPVGVPIGHEATHQFVLIHLKSWFASHLACVSDSDRNGEDAERSGAAEGEASQSGGEAVTP